jgi:hypothetical protein
VLATGDSLAGAGSSTGLALALLLESPAVAARAPAFAGPPSGAGCGVFRSAGALPVRNASSSSAMRPISSPRDASRRISINFTKPTSTW